MIFLFFAGLFEELKHLDIFLAELYKWVDILNTQHVHKVYIQPVYSEQS